MHYPDNNVQPKVQKMKKMIITLFALSVAAIVFAQDIAVSKVSAASPSPTAAFSWADTTYDFGKTKAGIPVSYEFRFTNTGMAPIIISSVKASCGCTVTAYTKDPVAHGASGFVRATYDAKKPGKYVKTVAVYANTPEGSIKLTVKGEVIE